MRISLVIVLGLLLTGIGGDGPTPQARTPTSIAEAFLNRVSKGEIGPAYDELFQGSPMAAQALQVDALKRQTEVGLPVYGKVLGFEFYDEEKFGGSLVRLVYIQRIEKHPIIWKFWMYRPVDAWQVNAVSFNDQMVF